MKLNTRVQPIFTHEGAVAKHINPTLQLRRSVCSCLLWENTFYEDGVTIASRIAELVPKVNPSVVAELAVEAREKFKLRHVPLLLVRELARQGYLGTAEVLSRIIQRPDELTEFLAIYWKDGKQPLSSQVKRGLAGAFPKFNEYQLAKYNRDGKIKLRDVLFLCHAKPRDEEQRELWKKLVDNNLQVPDTWEVSLSSGADKKESWERLLSEDKLGGLALLRNLRNMEKVGVKKELVANGIMNMKVDRILPYRFITAARYAMHYEPELEAAMLKCLVMQEKLAGRTILLIDVSGSMDWPLGDSTEVKRIDAACGLAILLREICDDIRVYTFSDLVVEVPPRRGFALRDAIVSSQRHSSTYLGRALRELEYPTNHYDRFVVITDEQSHDKVADPMGTGYMINVATYQNGVGYGGWNHIDGFSEAVVDWLREYERLLRKEGVDA